LRCLLGAARLWVRRWPHAVGGAHPPSVAAVNDGTITIGDKNAGVRQADVEEKPERIQQPIQDIIARGSRLRCCRMARLVTSKPPVSLYRKTGRTRGAWLDVESWSHPRITSIEGIHDVGRETRSCSLEVSRP
jgi:hypothetical protein